MNISFVTPSALPPVDHISRRRTCSSKRLTPRAVQSGVPSLLIVGAGVLGKEIAVQYAKANPGARIVGETLSDKSHDSLRSLGIIPALVGDGGDDFERLVFCAPPSGSKDYPGDVKRAGARLAEGGVGVFTGSGGVYAPSEDGLVSEDGKVLEERDRAIMLLRAEKAMLDLKGGMVVRLAGLYNLKRGAHVIYLRDEVKTLKGHGNSFLNLIHYEDAASLVIAALEKGPDGVEGRRLFLGADSSPIMRAEVCEAAMEHPLFKDGSIPEFDGEGPVIVKAYDNGETRRTLGWTPKWESFSVFMHENASKVPV